jgi:uncharacterized membrane protein YukC
MPKKTINDLQNDLDSLKSNFNDFKEENTRLYKELKAVSNPKQNPWYASAGVWLAILLTLAMIYLVYVFYMSETGHNVILPEFLNWKLTGQR